MVTNAPLNTISPACSVTDSGVMRNAVAHQEAVHRAHEVRVHDALGLPGRAARVHDVEEVVGRARRRLERIGLRVPRSAVVAVAGGRAVGEQHVRGQLVADFADRRQHRALRDETLRIRAAHQARQSRGHQQRRERHQYCADGRDRPVQLEELERVVEHGRDLVALADAERAKEVPGARHARPELRVGQPLAAEDNGDPVRPIARVPPDERGELDHAHAAPLPAPLPPPALAACRYR